MTWATSTTSTTSTSSSVAPVEFVDCVSDMPWERNHWMTSASATWSSSSLVLRSARPVGHFWADNGTIPDADSDSDSVMRLYTALDRASFHLGSVVMSLSASGGTMPCAQSSAPRTLHSAQSSAARMVRGRCTRVAPEATSTNSDKQNTAACLVSTSVEHSGRILSRRSDGMASTSTPKSWRRARGEASASPIRPPGGHRGWYERLSMDDAVVSSTKGRNHLCVCVDGTIYEYM
mmetsp:Transcript_12285/g.34920  ORF Transcript_12285/g.34920 Transcript_12285/m.34920 type:complete len:234 (+) Transcript_12285:1216-1917(+)